MISKIDKKYLKKKYLENSNRGCNIFIKAIDRVVGVTMLNGKAVDLEEWKETAKRGIHYEGMRYIEKAHKAYQKDDCETAWELVKLAKPFGIYQELKQIEGMLKTRAFMERTFDYN